MGSVARTRWTPNEDLVVAETVLKGIRNGTTMSTLFNEASEKLFNRTPGAIAYRWNNEIYKQYEQATQIAREQAIQKDTNNNLSEERVEKQFKNMMDNLTSHKEQSQPVQIEEKAVQKEEPKFTFEEEETIIVNKEIKYEDIFDFLKNQEQENTELKLKVIRLERQFEASENEKAKLQKELEEFQAGIAIQNEDYNALIQIMERARTLASK